MNLQALAEISQIVSAVAVIAAIVFGLVQIRQFRLQRRDNVAAELVRSFQGREFTRAFRLISALPRNASAAELRTRGVEVEDAALAIGVHFEALGLLIHRGIMPLSLMEQLTGGVVLDLWLRVRNWTLAEREEQAQPLFLEWFQWLAERIEERGRAGQAPAYVRFRDWQPPPE